MPRTVEAYVAVVRMLAGWAGGDPAALEEERVREYFVHLLRDRGYAPQSLRQARAALVEFYREMLGRREWTVFDGIKAPDRERLPVVLSRSNRELRGADLLKRAKVGRDHRRRPSGGLQPFFQTAVGPSPQAVRSARRSASPPLTRNPYLRRRSPNGTTKVPPPLR